MNFSLSHLSILWCLLAVLVEASVNTESDQSSSFEDSEQEDEVEVPPLVLLIYTYDDQANVTTFTDFEVTKTVNFLSSPDIRYLSRFVLLCPAPNEAGEEYKDVFFVESISRKIYSHMEDEMCRRYNKPSILRVDTTSYHQIGYKVKTMKTSSSDKSKSLNDQKTYFRDLKNAYSEGSHFELTYEEVQPGVYMLYLVEIFYNFNLMIPKIAIHAVLPHMHSNDYTKTCDNLDLGNEIFIDKKIENVGKMFDEFLASHEDFILQQLVPMQDFVGEYATAATCTYLNYTLLHKKFELALQQFENFVRSVADVLGKLRVQTGTYIEGTPKYTNPAVANIIWKQIDYLPPNDGHYSIVMVIHNQETRKICTDAQTVKSLGWPKGNLDETDVGSMYYCLMNNILAATLSISDFELDIETIKPFDLNHTPMKINGEITPVNVLDKIKEAKELKVLPLTLASFRFNTERENDAHTIAYTDILQLESEETTNPSLWPIGLKFYTFALLCPQPTNIEGYVRDVFYVESVIQRTSVDAEYQMCNRRYKPSIISGDDTMSWYSVGYLIHAPLIDFYEHESNGYTANISKISDPELDKAKKRAENSATQVPDELDEAEGKSENPETQVLDKATAIRQMKHDEGEIENPKLQTTDERRILKYLYESLRDYSITTKEDDEILTVPSFQIIYDFDRMSPKYTIHQVIAFMHSNDNSERCADLELGMEIFHRKNKNFDETTLKEFLNNHGDLTTHQMVPIHDFRGINATSTTCTYLNHTLLYKKAIESLQILETLIRDVSDFTGALLVTTGITEGISDDSNKSSKLHNDEFEGTLNVSNQPSKLTNKIEESNKSSNQAEEFEKTSNRSSQPSNSTGSIEEETLISSSKPPNQSILLIPTIFWKKIHYTTPDEDEFSILMVIHNRNIGRICTKPNKKLGWPEFYYGDGDGDIGTMYYCVFDHEVAKTLSLSEPLKEMDGKGEEVFNLYEVATEKADDGKYITFDVLNKIEEKRVENKNK